MFRRRLLRTASALLALLALSAAGLTAAGAGTVGGKYRSYAYLAISRSGAAVYINALVHQDTASGLAASPNRTVYLQRQLPAGWQNVLARRTDAHGRFTVGYLSAPSYPYRLIVTATATAWNATSATERSPLLGGVLQPGHSLVYGPANEAVKSPSGEFVLTLVEGDEFDLSQYIYVAAIQWTVGDLIYSIQGIYNQNPNDRSRLTMLGNGDLALISAAGKPLWSSHTSGAGNALYVQDDGNLVIYNTASRAVWSSHTTPGAIRAGTNIPSGKHFIENQHPQYNKGKVGLLEMRGDGNLVLSGGGVPVWASNTHVPGSRAAFTSNGSFVVYAPTGKLLWRSPSYGPYSVATLNCGQLQIFPSPSANAAYIPSALEGPSCG